MTNKQTPSLNRFEFTSLIPDLLDNFVGKSPHLRQTQRNIGNFLKTIRYESPNTTESTS
jgi:hypothetical protein